MSQVDRPNRRIVVILGPGGASRYLLDRLRPLLDADRDIELQGVFLQEAGVQHAAELPFVKELCRVTFSVREFNSKQFQRALALRVRTAHQALSVLALRVGVPLTFRNATGSAVKLLREETSDADFTVFEPARPPVAAALARRSGAPRHRITAVICDTATGRAVLGTALKLAEGNRALVNVLLFPASGQHTAELRTLYREFLQGEPGNARLVEGRDLNQLALSSRELFSSMLVVPATEELTLGSVLQFLRAQVRCPVCLVRNLEQ